MVASMLGRGVSGRRALHLSVRCSKKVDRRVAPAREEPPEIPGLQRVTYEGRGYFLPWLYRPALPEWRPDWPDPRRHRCPPASEMPLYRAEEAYVYNPFCRLLGGVKQALWLTKSSIIEGLPQSIVSISEDPAHNFPDQEELLHNTVANACLWSTTEEEERPREEYCPKLLQGLLHLCRAQSWQYPGLAHRSFIQNYRLAASWRRESVLYLLRSSEGLVMSAKTPLQAPGSPSDIQMTEQQSLSSLYPLSPAIDLQEVNVYEERNYLGYRDGYPFSQPHTIYLQEPCNTRAKFQPDQLRAKMIMTAFACAAAKAKMLYGEEVKVLQDPLAVQCVATDGQLFHFLLLQLNTLDVDSGEGMKNLVWMDGDQALYDTALAKNKLFRKEIVVPAGVSGLNVTTFRKFWAMYLNGAV